MRSSIGLIALGVALSACSGGGYSSSLYDSTGDGGTDGGDGDESSSGGAETGMGGDVQVIDETGGSASGGGSGGTVDASGGSSGGTTADGGSTGGDGSGGDVGTGGESSEGWPEGTPDCAPANFSGCEDTNHKSYCTDHGLTGAFMFACTGTESPGSGCERSPKDPGLDHVAWCCPQICQPNPMWSELEKPFGFRCVSEQVPDEVPGCAVDDTYINDLLHCSEPEPAFEEEHCYIPDVCEPPDLSEYAPGEASGNDLSNLCGWTTENYPPDGYAFSSTLDWDCDEYDLDRTLADSTGVKDLVHVPIIDASDQTCTFEDPIGGGHRRFLYTQGFCTKVSTPFESAYVRRTYGATTTDEYTDCKVYSAPGTNMILDIEATEDSWIRIDTAELDGNDECPLSCD